MTITKMISVNTLDISGHGIQPGRDRTRCAGPGRGSGGTLASWFISDLPEDQNQKIQK